MNNNKRDDFDNNNGANKEARETKSKTNKEQGEEE